MYDVLPHAAPHANVPQGDVVLLDRFSVRFRKLRPRGEVVTLMAPSDSSKTLFARIIAAPADWVSILALPYCRKGHEQLLSPSLGSWQVDTPGARVNVPNGCAWLEGDSALGIQEDSETYGPVSKPVLSTAYIDELLQISLGLVETRVAYVLWPPAHFGRVERYTNMNRIKTSLWDP